MSDHPLPLEPIKQPDLETPTPDEASESLQPDTALKKKNLWRDLLLGFLGGLVGNVLLAGFLFFPTVIFGNYVATLSESRNITVIDIFLSIVGLLIFLLPIALNIGVIILLAVKRRPYIVLGIVCGFGLAFLTVLIAGLFYFVTCSAFGSIFGT